MILIFLISCSQRKPAANTDPAAAEKFRTEGKRVIVYTTADSTNYRLTVTDTIQFKELLQPLETQVCVFTDPDKTYQTFMGIGGALTDASAETFSKIPEPNKKSCWTPTLILRKEYVTPWQEPILTAAIFRVEVILMSLKVIRI